MMYSIIQVPGCPMVHIPFLSPEQLEEHSEQWTRGQRSLPNSIQHAYLEGNRFVFNRGKSYLFSIDDNQSSTVNQGLDPFKLDHYDNQEYLKKLKFILENHRTKNDLDNQVKEKIIIDVVNTIKGPHSILGVSEINLKDHDMTNSKNKFPYELLIKKDNINLKCRTGVTFGEISIAITLKLYKKSRRYIALNNITSNDEKYGLKSFYPDYLGSTNFGPNLLKTIVKMIYKSNAECEENILYENPYCIKITNSTMNEKRKSGIKLKTIRKSDMRCYLEPNYKKEVLGNIIEHNHSKDNFLHTSLGESGKPKIMHDATLTTSIDFPYYNSYHRRSSKKKMYPGNEPANNSNNYNSVFENEQISKYSYLKEVENKYYIENYLKKYEREVSKSLKLHHLIENQINSTKYQNSKSKTSHGHGWLRSTPQTKPNIYPIKPTIKMTKTSFLRQYIADLNKQKEAQDKAYMKVSLKPKVEDKRMKTKSDKKSSKNPIINNDQFVSVSDCETIPTTSDILPGLPSDVKTFSKSYSTRKPVNSYISSPIEKNSPSSSNIQTKKFGKNNLGNPARVSKTLDVKIPNKNLPEKTYEKKIFAEESEVNSVNKVLISKSEEKILNESDSNEKFRTNDKFRSFTPDTSISGPPNIHNASELESFLSLMERTTSGGEEDISNKDSNFNRSLHLIEEQTEESDSKSYTSSTKSKSYTSSSKSKSMKKHSNINSKNGSSIGSSGIEEEFEQMTTDDDTSKSSQSANSNYMEESVSSDVNSVDDNREIVPDDAEDNPSIKDHILKASSTFSWGQVVHRIEDLDLTKDSSCSLSSEKPMHKSINNNCKSESPKINKNENANTHENFTQSIKTSNSKMGSIPATFNGDKNKIKDDDSDSVSNLSDKILAILNGDGDCDDLDYDDLMSLSDISG